MSTILLLVDLPSVTCCSATGSFFAAALTHAEEEEALWGLFLSASATRTDSLHSAVAARLDAVGLGLGTAPPRYLI